MQSRGKRPPGASPEELEELEPTLEPPGGVGKPRLNLGGGLGMMIAVSAVVAFMVFAVMGLMGGGSFLTKKQFEDNLAGMVETLNQAKAEVAVAQSTVDTAIAGLPTTVTAQVNTAMGAVLTRLTAAETNMTTFQAQLTAFETSTTTDVAALAALKASLTALQTQVTALTTKVDSWTASTPSGSSVVEGDLLVEIKVQSLYDEVYLPKDTPINTEIPVALKLKLTNNSAKDMEDIMLGLIFEPVSYTSPSWSSGYPVLESPMTTWTKYSDVYGMVFMNSTWGLKVDAGDTKTIYLTLRLSVDTALTVDHLWEPSVDIDDYELVN